MLRRDGNYYQRRHQLDRDGKQVNVMEKQIDFILDPAPTPARTCIGPGAAR